MDEVQRKSVFDYVFEKADAIGYMGLDSAESKKFQDDLENDSKLMKIAGERLQRNYIKDTILNRYSKLRRYIEADDILGAIDGITAENIVGNKDELENGLFKIIFDGIEIPCTSASFSEWQTVLKRFGSQNGNQVRFAFITCGGIRKSDQEISEVKKILLSYSVVPFVVKPNDVKEHISKFITHRTNTSKPDSGAVLSEMVSQFADFAGKAGFRIERAEAHRFLASLLAKRFLISTGLAGSGKTKLAEAFAMWLSETPDQYRIVAVGADWTSNENLLGYADALQPGKYRAPVNGALELLLRAADDVDGKPYFLILDEMNLSHVERYFADFLSAMESDNAPLSLHGAASALALDEKGAILVPAKQALPANLFIIGTVNVDETTYMFSPKVLDRANVIEFRATANQMDAFLSSPTGVNLKALEAQGTPFASAFVQHAQADADIANLTDTAGNKLTQKFKDDLLGVFTTLTLIGAEFGFRTAKEIARFMVIHKELSGPGWAYKDALDAQVLQKLMPKLHGSARKLSGVLKALEEFAKAQDLPLTLEKVLRMQQRLARDGFTSFAEA
jgi:hypothetical protein